MPAKPKVLRFELAYDEEGCAAAENGPALGVPDDWTAEHLVLAGLARCSLTSLGYYARREDVTASGSASVSGSVTRREDGAYGFVEIAIELDVRLEPEPDDVAALLESAEWGCFVGQSLQPKPGYRWRVNGREVA